MPDILLISGSPSASSRSAAVLDYARDQLSAEKLETTVVSVREFPPEDLILGKYDSPVFDGIKRLIEEADGIVVGTPIYKAAYSGALKTLLDILPQAALRGKTVLPIATGGSPAHVLAIDYALKPVLSALGATDLLQGVYIVDKQLALQPDGELRFADEEARTRLREALGLLVSNVRARSASVQTQG
jgi:FMN reductase